MYGRRWAELTWLSQPRPWSLGRTRAGMERPWAVLAWPRMDDAARTSRPVAVGLALLSAGLVFAAVFFGGGFIINA